MFGAVALHVKVVCRHAVAAPNDEGDVLGCNLLMVASCEPVAPVDVMCSSDLIVRVQWDV